MNRLELDGITVPSNNSDTCEQLNYRRWAREVKTETIRDAQIFGLSEILSQCCTSVARYPEVSDGTLNQWIGETWLFNHVDDETREIKLTDDVSMPLELLYREARRTNRSDLWSAVRPYLATVANPKNEPEVVR